MYFPHEFFLQRCADLANLATSATSPNPRVGAVLVHENRIIGEGYFQQVGQAHAEVNCLKSVAETDRQLISSATLYVSLEPCCFHGRTPACTGLIIEHKIPKVVIGQLDQTAEVSGQGIAILNANGVETLSFPAFQPTQRVAQARQLFAAANRPFVLLKFAKSADGFLAPSTPEPYWITGEISRRMVHFWRSRTSAIVVGAGTLLKDNPRLDTRLYPGPSPLVCVVDLGNKITHGKYRMLQEKPRREFILIQTEGASPVKEFKQLFIPLAVSNVLKSFNFKELQSSQAAKKGAKAVVDLVLGILKNENINHITVEGGQWLLNLFLSAEIWDEARVFTGTSTYFAAGLEAPTIQGEPTDRIEVQNDLLERWYVG